MKNQGELFEVSSIVPGAIMGPRARLNDPETSKAAADRIGDRLSELQSLVLKVFEANEARARGEDDIGLTAGEAELTKCFAGCKPSTVRKRISKHF